MNETVWVSNAMIDQSLIKRLQADVKLANLKVGEENALRHIRGQTLRTGEMPKRFFSDPRYGKIKSLIHLCQCNGFMIASKQAADVLARFDLGEGGVFPVEIYQPDKTTIFDIGYHFLNFGALKNALVASQSVGLRDPGHGLKYFTMPPVMADDAVAVSFSSLTGPDLWTDPGLSRAFFASDRLMNALKKEKLTRAFRFYLCKMVEG